MLLATQRGCGLGAKKGTTWVADAWGQIAPKEDEAKALQGYSGPLEELSVPEQFLLVMSAVPRLHEKIHLLIHVRQFDVSPFFLRCTIPCPAHASLPAQVTQQCLVAAPLPAQLISSLPAQVAQHCLVAANLPKGLLGVWARCC
jgi:hypothetical protein